MKLNVFLVFTPYHYYMAKNIIEFKKLDAIIFNYSEIEIEKSVYFSIRTTKGLFSKFFRLYELNRSIRCFGDLLESYSDIDLYVPHFDSIATNLIYTKYKSVFSGIYVYEEGLANYYDARFSVSRQVINFVFGLLVGKKATFMKGNITRGWSVDIKAIYVTNNYAMEPMYKEKCIELDVKKKISLYADYVLIAAHDIKISRFEKSVSVIQRAEKLVTLAKESNAANIIYKPHPRSILNHETITKICGNSVEVVNKNIDILQLIKEQGCPKLFVVGCSSAYFQMKSSCELTEIVVMGPCDNKTKKIMERSDVYIS